MTSLNIIISELNVMGMTICNTNEFVQSQFSDGVLIVRYINKMGTNGGGGEVTIANSFTNKLI